MRTPDYKSPRPKQIRLCLPSEVFDKFKIAAAIDGVAYSYKAFLVISQYVEDHAQQIEEYASFMKQFNQKNNPINRQPIRIKE